MLSSRQPELLPRAILIDRLLFITLTMTAIGLVGLVVWDGVFPDRRDARILGALPLRARTMIAGRLLALAALVGIFLIGVTAIPTLFYGALVGAYGAASSVIHGIAAHLVATSLAGLFVFALLLTLQGCVLTFGSRHAADRLSVAFQLVFVVLLLQMPFFLPSLGSLLPRDPAQVWSDPWIRAIPSMWFLALYDAIAGNRAPGAGGLALKGLLAALGAMVAAVLLLVTTHGRLLSRALESQQVSGRRNRLLVGVVDWLMRIACPRPVARATCEFTLRTFARSRSHRLMLSSYVGVALAIVASAIVPLAIRSGIAGFARPGLEVLSAPLIIGFFTMIGMRVALAIPAEPRANWIVRLSEPADRIAVINGVRAAFLAAGVVPTSVIAAASAAVLWGWWPALVHGLVCLLMGWLLIEVLCLRLSKIPFTCTYLPGGGRVGTLWPLYMTAFVTYAFTTARIEIFFMQRPRALLIFATLIGSIIAVLTVVRRRDLSALTSLRFEEDDPTTLFEGFHLSEALAARPSGPK